MAPGPKVFFYGDQEVSGLDTATRQELESVFGDGLISLASFTQTARYSLRAYEAALVAL